MQALEGQRRGTWLFLGACRAGYGVFKRCGAVRGGPQRCEECSLLSTQIVLGQAGMAAQIAGCHVPIPTMLLPLRWLDLLYHPVACSAAGRPRWRYGTGARAATWAARS